MESAPRSLAPSGAPPLVGEGVVILDEDGAVAVGGTIVGTLGGRLVVRWRHGGAEMSTFAPADLTPIAPDRRVWKPAP